MATRRSTERSSAPRRRPATTPEVREQQLVSLAYDLAEKQMRDGEASSQVITHFLKVGASRERLEQEKLARENELLRAKSEQLESMKRVESLYAEAIEAMRSYTGHDSSDPYDD